MTVTLDLSAPKLDIAQIHAWADNPRPRTQFTEEALADILPSIRENGILEPIVVRTRPKGGYWIVMGERRFQSAKLAGLTDVPAILRECDDTTALKLALEENIKRKNLHPLDEAAAYARMGGMDAAYRDPKALAAFVSQSVSQVRRRMKLVNLTVLVADAFRADAITAAHAERLAVLAIDEQDEALKDACFGWLAGDTKKLLAAKEWAKLAPALEPVSTLDHWISNHAALDTKDESVQQDLIEELAAEPTDGAPAVTPEMLTACLRLSEQTYLSPGGAKKLSVVTPDKWKEVNAARPCEYAQPALVVHGGRRRVLYACVNPKCKQHLGKPKPSAASPASAHASKATPAKPLTPEQQKALEQQQAQVAAEQFDLRVDEEVVARLPVALAKHIQLKKPAPQDLLKVAILASGMDVLPSIADVERIAKVKVGPAIGLYLGLTAVVGCRGMEKELTDGLKLLKFDQAKFRNAIADEIKTADAKKKATAKK